RAVHPASLPPHLPSFPTRRSSDLPSTRSARARMEFTFQVAIRTRATVARKVVRWDTQAIRRTRPAAAAGTDAHGLLQPAALDTRGPLGSNPMRIVEPRRRGRGPFRCGPEPPPRGGAGRRRVVRTGSGEAW